MRRLLCGMLVFAASIVFAPSAIATGFGLQDFSMSATNQNGSPDVQAGSHPFELTTSFTLNEPRIGSNGTYQVLFPEGSLKEVQAELPAGFIGDPNATPKCDYQEFISAGHCPNDTAVGWAVTFVIGGEEILSVTEPVYNVETPPGVPAEFGFRVDGLVPAFLDASVRTGGDYGITISSRNIPEVASIYGVKVVIWGVPGEPSHNALRGSCLGKEEDEPEAEESLGQCPDNVPVVPLLTNPTSCGIPRAAKISVDSWQEPGKFVSLSSAFPELSGCERLPFSPTIGVTPDGAAGSTPTGLNVDLHVPQESTKNPAGLAEADVKDTSVTLPAGVQLSPSAADGLQACSQAQVGLENAEKPSCPNAAKVATVKIATPLLEHELEGAVYLASPQNFAGSLENPFGSLVALYLVAEEPASGVLIKLAGKVSPNPVTGQLVTTFENTPQLPFSDLKLEFFGTDRAPLTTPALCGTYTTETSIAPWSGASVASPTSAFQVGSGPGGTPCSDPLPFAPSLASGTTNIDAGAFGALTTTLSREDGQQPIQSVTLHYPPGLSGLLSGVKLCGEAEADAGTCGPESEIGETIVSAGLGNDPFTVTGGKVYITGPYEGAPFGLSIVNPAKAGPFDLQEGRPVVVRAKIEVNSTTAALTITTDNSGPYAIPQIIDGIPLQIKHVNVDVNRSGFTINPTSCNPMAITGTVNSAEGASSPVSIPFEVANCASLKFQPTVSSFTASTDSVRDGGASLVTKVSYPSTAQGTEADIARVKVELPVALPSRLTTLQKACVAKVFEADPASCPAESFIGHAVVHTPLLPVPLEGPAIFVSHGGEAFPSVIVVLQGYGVTVDLVGTTFISHAGVTSTTFKTVPDSPFSSFELALPEGKFSALAATTNVCDPTRIETVKKTVSERVRGKLEKVTKEVKETVAAPLEMPTELIGQNGAEIHVITKIAVTGCKKATADKAVRKKKQGKRDRKGKSQA
jgi:hypothetical protein